jgi:hypothetical protein
MFFYHNQFSMLGESNEKKTFYVILMFVRGEIWLSAFFRLKVEGLRRM